MRVCVFVRVLITINQHIYNISEEGDDKRTKWAFEEATEEEGQK